MKRTFQILVLMVGAIAAFKVFADEKDAPKKKPKVIPIVPVYLGHSTINGGVVAKPLFDSLIKQGLTAKDSAGRVFNVKSFMLTFCERALYEDSIGNLMPLTDYLSEYCFDNKLNEYQQIIMLERTKSGDTVIFEKILLNAADTTKAGAYGKPVRVIIGK